MNEVRDTNKYLIPSLEHIKKLYNKIIPLMENLKTKEDVINFENEYKTTMEINYDIIKYYDENQPIEVIRCESLEDLCYIYVYSDGSTPIFDVWCDFIDDYFMDGATIKSIEKDYIDGIKWLWSISKSNIKKLKEIISILRQHGIEYNDMIEIYGFETKIVEEYKNNEYNK